MGAGAGAGALIGSAFGGVGAIPGALIGAGLGAVGPLIWGDDWAKQLDSIIDGTKSLETAIDKSYKASQNYKDVLVQYKETYNSSSEATKKILDYELQLAKVRNKEVTKNLIQESGTSQKQWSKSKADYIKADTKYKQILDTQDLMKAIIKGEDGGKITTYTDSLTGDLKFKTKDQS